MVGDRHYEIFNIKAPALAERHDIEPLPYSIKVILENLLRHEDGPHVSADDIVAVAAWGVNPEGHGQGAGDAAHEIALTPERVLMQDFTGVPGVVDLAAMRDALARLGGDATQVNPLVPVELVIDHSVIVERSGDAVGLRPQRLHRVLAQHGALPAAALGPGRVPRLPARPPRHGHLPPGEPRVPVPPRLRHRGRACLLRHPRRAPTRTPTMVNGLGVLGWGVGGIEAEAAMLGQPLSMLLPPVVGLRISGEPKPGITATDVVLTVTELLRDHGVVGAFVECYGPGVAALPLETRATIGNMSPEYGATCTMFPIDQVTLDYLRFTGRDEEHLALVEAYAKAQGLWHDPAAPEPRVLRARQPRPGRRGALAGRALPTAGPGRAERRPATPSGSRSTARPRTAPTEPAAAPHHQMPDGDVVIAAITSCTNTSNPQVLVGAGLLAKKAVERGLRSKPWVKTSLAPGSRVVIDYLERAGLIEPLQQLGFYLVGYGCTTCIGNSGPLLDGVTDAVQEGDLSVAAVLSGNRNFEGRIHPDVRHELPGLAPARRGLRAGRHDGPRPHHRADRPGRRGQPGAPLRAVALDGGGERDHPRLARPPTCSAPATAPSSTATSTGSRCRTEAGETYAWQDDSTYVKNPPFFETMTMTPAPVTDIVDARVLAMVGDSVTTDHISPAGSIGPTTPAGRYLTEHGVAREDFNSYGARRGNHEVMMRGTFANVRLRNRLAPGTEGGVTLHLPDGTETSIYEAAMQYAARGRAAGRAGGPRVRDREQPRLGGQGDGAPRRAGRHRAELRAHPPLQPHRHGRRARCSSTRATRPRAWA